MRADFASGIASLEEVRPGLGYGTMRMGDRPQEPQGDASERLRSSAMASSRRISTKQLTKPGGSYC